MKCWDESFLLSTAALTCTSAKYVRNSATLARKITSRRCAARDTFLPWQGRRLRTQADEESVPQDFPFVLDRASAVHGAGDSGHCRHAPGAADLRRRSIAVQISERSGRRLSDRRCG